MRSFFFLGLLFVLGLLPAQESSFTLVDSLTLRTMQSGPLEIRSSPPGANVSIHGISRGITPLNIDTINAGRYLLEVSHSGYKNFTHEIILEDGKSYQIYINLEESMGYFQWDSEIPGELYDHGVKIEPLSGSLYKLSTGVHRLKFLTFGYEPQSLQVEISEGRTFTFRPPLTPAQLKLSRLSYWPRVINPQNPGALGSLQVFFHTNGPGTASYQIKNDQNQVLLEGDLGPFSTWDQTFSLVSKELPQEKGTYSLEIKSESSEITQTFYLDPAYNLYFFPQKGGNWEGIAPPLPALGLRVSFLGNLALSNLDPQWNMALSPALGLGLGMETGFYAQTDQEGGIKPYLRGVWTWGNLSFGFGILGGWTAQNGFFGEIHPALGITLGPMVTSLGLNTRLSPESPISLTPGGSVVWLGEGVSTGFLWEKKLSNEDLRLDWSTQILIPGSGTWIGLSPGLQLEDGGILFNFGFETGFTQ